MARAELPYTEIAPPRDLAVHVDRLWLRTSLGGAPGGQHRVLPDGCVDIIVRADRGTAELVGAMTCAIEVPDAPSEIVAVRFRPGTAAAVARSSLAALTDRHADLADLGIAGDLAGRVSDAGRAEDRLAALVAWLRHRLAAAPAVDAKIAHAIARLSTSEVRVEHLAAELGITRQYLAQRFRSAVGLTPKQLSRIARMQRAVAALAGGRPDLARLAVDLGYFDQAHLANDLRELAGATPAELATAPVHAVAHLFARSEFPFLQSPPPAGP